MKHENKRTARALKMAGQMERATPPPHLFTRIERAIESEAREGHMIDSRSAESWSRRSSSIRPAALAGSFALFLGLVLGNITLIEQYESAPAVTTTSEATVTSSTTTATASPYDLTSVFDNY